MVVVDLAGVEGATVGGFNPFMLVMMAGMLGLLFFMQSRARKQAAQRNEFRSQLAVGQRVMTQGGLVGTIVAINEATDTIILDSAGSRCEYMRQGIAKTLDDAGVGIGIPVGQVPAVPANPQYGVNVGTGANSATGVAAPVAGGFLANALGNLSGANAGPSVSDDELAELDAISKDYYESRGHDGTGSGPVVVVENE